LAHRLPADEHRLEEEDHGPERGQALRHRGAGRVPAEGRRHSRRPRGVRRRARGARGLGGMTNPVTAGSPGAPSGESPPGAARVLAALAAAGTGPSKLAALTLDQVPPSPALERLRQRRAELGLPVGDDAPLLIDPATSAPLAGDAVPLHLRRAHTTRVSIEANAGICRGMLRHRYGTSGLGEEEQ